MNCLSIFDLDNTLITCDSDVAWASYLTEKGIWKEKEARLRDKFYNDYDNGCLDIDAFLRFQLSALAQFSCDELNSMHKEYMAKYIKPHITKTAIKLVANHLEKNDEVLLISATNEFIITPIAHEFGINNIIGVSLEKDDKGFYTGNYLGVPSFREGKVTRLQQWLNHKAKTLDDYETTYFYSDSHNDLPLLSLVKNPIAVNPDKKLAQHAQNLAWKIINFTE